MSSHRQEDYENQLKDKIKISPPKKVSERIKIFRQALAKELVVKLDPEEIKTDENIRREIDVDSNEFRQLVESIKEHGVLQSIVVEYSEIDGDSCSLKCLAGHRRLAALKASGLKVKVPAKLFSGEKGNALRVALTENVIRKNLHFVEIADTYKAIQDFESIDVAELASRFDKSSKTVDRYLKIAHWKPEIRNLLIQNKDIFTFSFVKENYIDKSRTEGEILNSIKKRIEAKNSNKNVKMPSRQGAKTARKRKLEKYFQDNSIHDEHKTIINQALEFLGLL